MKFLFHRIRVTHSKSLPSWERGLKYLKKLPVVGSDHVAPLVGAWIEIETAAGGGTGNMSLPSWERGLKSFSASLSRNENTVAPLVGAWIEISEAPPMISFPPVAPLVGAWIEILNGSCTATDL